MTSEAVPPPEAWKELEDLVRECRVDPPLASTGLLDVLSTDGPPDGEATSEAFARSPEAAMSERLAAIKATPAYRFMSEIQSYREAETAFFGWLSRKALSGPAEALRNQIQFIGVSAHFLRFRDIDKSLPNNLRVYLTRREMEQAASWCEKLESVLSTTPRLAFDPLLFQSSEDGRLQFVTLAQVLRGQAENFRKILERKGYRRNDDTAYDRHSVERIGRLLVTAFGRSIPEQVIASLAVACGVSITSQRIKQELWLKHITNSRR